VADLGVRARAVDLAREEAHESIAAGLSALSHDRTLAELDRRLADADRACSEADQRSADVERIAAAMDQRAADIDQAASDRRLLTGGDPQLHARTRRLRQAAGERRSSCGGEDGTRGAAGIADLGERDGRRPALA
jgi:hypothetical protein